MSVGPQRWLATVCLLAGTMALATASGCAAPAEEETDGEAGAEAALTVTNGAEYIESIDSAGTITVKKSVRGAALKFVAGDFANKGVLVHPIPGKTENGIYGHVESVEDRGDTLVVRTRALDLEEMENTRGVDVIRLYRDPSLQLAPTTPEPEPLEARDFASLPGSLFQPTTPSDFGIRPLAFSGPLSGDLSPEVWIGKGQTSVGGQVTSSVQSASVRFRPSAILDYTRGRGLTVGVRGSFNADLAVRATGKVTGAYKFFETPKLRSPRARFIVPIGIPPLAVPVPVFVGVDAHVECSTTGALRFDGVFQAHLGVTASASTIVSPSLRKPLDQWVAAGPWENGVRASMTFGKTPESTIEGTAGIKCSLPQITFPVTVAGLVGPFLAIKPKLELTTSGSESAVELYTGVTSDVSDAATVQVLLLRWKP